MKNLSAGDVGFVAVILAGAAMLMTALPTIYRQFNSGDIYERIRQSDPSLGTKVALPENDIDGRSLGRGRKLVVFVGQCTGCSIRAFDREKLATPPDMQVIVVVESHAVEVPSDLRLMRDAHTLADFERRLTGQLNARWNPRLVLLDESHRVQWLQPRPGVFPPGVKYE